MISLQQLAHLIHGYPNPSRNFQSEYRCFTPSSSCWHKLVIGNVSIITWLQPVYLIREHPNRYFQFEYNSFTPATAVVIKKNRRYRQSSLSLQRPIWLSLDRSRSAVDVERSPLVLLIRVAIS